MKRLPKLGYTRIQIKKFFRDHIGGWKCLRYLACSLLMSLKYLGVDRIRYSSRWHHQKHKFFFDSYKETENNHFPLEEFIYNETII